MKRIKGLMIAIMVIVTGFSFSVEKNKGAMRFGLSSGIETNSFSNLNYPGVLPMSIELKMYHKGLDLGFLNFFFGKGVDETSLSYAFSGSETSYSSGGWIVGTSGNTATITQGKLTSIGYKSRWYYCDPFKESGFSLTIFTHLLALMQSTNNSGFGGWDLGVDIGYHMPFGEGLSWDIFLSPTYSSINNATVNGVTGSLSSSKSDFKANLSTQITFYL